MNFEGPKPTESEIKEAKEQGGEGAVEALKKRFEEAGARQKIERMEKSRATEISPKKFAVKEKFSTEQEVLKREAEKKAKEAYE